MAIFISITFLVVPFISIFLWLVFEVNNSRGIYRVALGVLSIISTAYFSASITKKEAVALQKYQQMLIDKQKPASER
ncbi:hypothetical protein ACJJIE_11545 [Microbulbifer sp. TRSA001]|uniref:hypothetical protein n=1 Tax=Microbulbifer sp. TRSA001 TaxID=3243381 RepID=UPI004039AC57